LSTLYSVGQILGILNAWNIHARHYKFYNFWPTVVDVIFLKKWLARG